MIEGKVVGVVGTPHSGKSVFLHNLYTQLSQKTSNFFLQGVIIDGDGQWFFKSPIASEIRQKFKDYQAYKDYTIKSIENLKKTKKLIFIDLGGIPSEENAEILRHCDYYIFLIRPDKPKLIKKWQELLDSLDIKPLAIFESVWMGEAKVVSNLDIFKGVLVRLDRSGVPKQTLDVISQFVQWILSKFELAENNEGIFSINIKESEHWIFLDVKITSKSGIIEPSDLPKLLAITEHKVGLKHFGKGVIISGRLPIWAHSALAHLFHSAKFVAHFDPRIGAVVVQSHSTDYKIGQIISLNQII